MVTGTLSNPITSLRIGGWKQRASKKGLKSGGALLLVKEDVTLFWLSNLKHRRKKLKKWSKSIQGNLEMQKLSILSQLAELEETHDQRSLTEEEIHTKYAVYGVWGDCKT